MIGISKSSDYSYWLKVWLMDKSQKEQCSSILASWGNPSRIRRPCIFQLAFLLLWQLLMRAAARPGAKLRLAIRQLIKWDCSFFCISWVYALSNGLQFWGDMTEYIWNWTTQFSMASDQAYGYTISRAGQAQLTEAIISAPYQPSPVLLIHSKQILIFFHRCNSLGWNFPTGIPASHTTWNLGGHFCTPPLFEMWLWNAFLHSPTSEPCVHSRGDDTAYFCL